MPNGFASRKPSEIGLQLLIEHDIKATDGLLRVDVAVIPESGDKKSPSHACSLYYRKCGNCVLEVRVVQVAAMPAHASFHEGNALSFDSVGDNDARLFRHL